MNGDALELFQETVWEFYRTNGRHGLPWRQLRSDGSMDPYAILISEIMLQQTQVERVIPKYELFLKTYPTVIDLADAELGEVLKIWSGLGYNRRAKFIHQAAHKIAQDHQGIVPRSKDKLIALPGIGKNTAGAILVYAFNLPEVFIETNIKTVYVYHFFESRNEVADRDIEQAVAASMDKEHPREWYWALMDYGSHIKRSIGNLTRATKGYSKQSTFEGSKRQVRGLILRLLIDEPQTEEALRQTVSDNRTDEIIATLLEEGLIVRKGDYLRL